MRINTLTNFKLIASNNKNKNAMSNNVNNQSTLKLSNQNYMTDTVSFGGKTKPSKVKKQAKNAVKNLASKLQPKPPLTEHVVYENGLTSDFTYHDYQKYKNGMIKQAKKIEIKLSNGYEATYTDIDCYENGQEKQVKQVIYKFASESLVTKEILDDVHYYKNNEVSMSSKKTYFKDENPLGETFEEFKNLKLDDEGIISKCSSYQVGFQPEAPLEKIKMIDATYDKKNGFFNAKKLIYVYRTPVSEMVVDSNYLAPVVAEHMIIIYPENAQTHVTREEFINKPLYSPDGEKIADTQYKMTLQKLKDGGIPTLTNPELDENGYPRSAAYLEIDYSGTDLPVKKEVYYGLEYKNDKKEFAKKYIIVYDPKHKDNKYKIKRDEWINPQYDGEGKIVKADKYTMCYLDNNNEQITREIDHPDVVQIAKALHNFSRPSFV